MPRLCVDKQTLIPFVTKKYVDILTDWVHSVLVAICLWITEGKCIISGEIPIKPAIRESLPRTFGQSYPRLPCKTKSDQSAQPDSLGSLDCTQSCVVTYF